MFKKIVALLLGFQFLTFAAGATTTYKICGLPDAQAVYDTDHFELSRACNGSYNATAAELAAYLLAKAPGASGQLIFNSGGVFTATSAATVAGILQRANNLSDLASAPAALTNLGLTPFGKSLASAAGLASNGLVIGNGANVPTALTGTAPGQVPTWNGSAYVNATPGNVTGPASPTDRTLPRISGPAGTALLPSNIAVSDNDEISGYRQLVVPSAASARTLAPADRGTTLRFTGGTAITVTLPSALPLGFSVEVVQDGTGQVSFVAASGATLTNAHAQTKTFGQYAAVRLLVTQNSDGASASYNLVGDTGP